MKKCVSLLLCFALLFAFSACGKTDVEMTSETVSTTAETTSETTTAVTTTLETTTAVSTSAETTTSSIASDVTTTDLPASSAPETTLLTTSTTATTSTTESTTETKVETVSFTIECGAINDDPGKLDPDKKEFVPSDGIIFSGNVAVKENETVFDVLKRLCAENHCKADCKYCKKGIQIEYTFTPAYNNYYIEGIHQIYEFDCGSSSGWVYTVNGNSPDVGCSSYPAKAGDVIVFEYVI